MTFLRFFLFNLVGNALPAVTALVSIPLIAHHAGVGRLGALGVVWALVGYFGFLDFGLSRVVTRRVALAVEHDRLSDELTELRSFLWWWAVPVLVAMTVLALAVGLLFPGIFPHGWLGQEVASSWAWIAVGVPATLATNWLRGALEGVRRFVRVNLLRSVFGAWTYAAPAAIAFYSPTLKAMIAAIVLGRIVALLAHVWACWQVEPGIVVGPTPRGGSNVRQFFQEGGWITVSNLISPLMVYFDRFVLASLVSATAVAWYVTSHELMLRALTIPAALAGVLFPMFSGGAKSEPSQALLTLYQRGVRFISALMLPLCVCAAVGAYDALRLWMGGEFAIHAYRVIAILAVGIFINSIAHLPFAWLQGVGRSNLTARIHLIELPLYALGLYYGVHHAGITGAAWMWTARVILDWLLMLLVAAQRGTRNIIVIGLAGAVFIGIVGILSGPGWEWQWRAGMGSGVFIVALLFAWWGLLHHEDRKELLRFRKRPM